MSAGRVLPVNLGGARAQHRKRVAMTGIDKRPVDHPVAVRAPGPKTTGLHSGLVGDQIFDIEHHGGDDQAVYAYAREDYDWWEAGRARPARRGLRGKPDHGGVDVAGR